MQVAILKDDRETNNKHIIRTNFSSFHGLWTRTKKKHENAMTKFEEFRKKEKFISDEKLFYPGIGDIAQKPILTEKINLAADDFEELAKKATLQTKTIKMLSRMGLIGLRIFT